MSSTPISKNEVEELEKLVIAISGDDNAKFFPKRYVEALTLLLERRDTEARIDELEKLLHKDVCEVMCGWSKICDKEENCVPIRKRILELKASLNQGGEDK